MAILTIGSVNIDHIYRVAALPRPGETVADKGYRCGFGGKGANQSLAAALAGAEVHHAGAVGADGAWCRKRLADAGIGIEGLVTVDAATGHAVIMVDDAGENCIVIHPGANRALASALAQSAIAHRARGDWLLVQNETNLVAESAGMARGAGLQVAYAAAPFDPGAAAEMVGLVDLLAVNAVEAAQLAGHLGQPVEALPVPGLLVTLGAEGAVYHAGGETVRASAFPVEPVDTTGAGDTFLGYFLAGLDAGMPPAAALRRASAASAIQVTRPGAADAMPGLAEVDAFLARQAD